MSRGDRDVGLADVGGLIYRSGGTNPSNMRTRPGEEGVSFRDSLTNPPEPWSPTFAAGGPYFGLDPSYLPEESVVYDGGGGGLPPGHVTVRASAEEIRIAWELSGRFKGVYR